MNNLIYFLLGAAFPSLGCCVFLARREYLLYDKNLKFFYTHLESQTIKIDKITSDLSIILSEDPFSVIDSLNLVNLEILPSVLKSCFIGVHVLIVFFLTKKELLNLCDISEGGFIRSVLLTSLLQPVLSNFCNTIFLEILKSDADTKSHVFSEFESLKNNLENISVVNTEILSASTPNRVLALIENLYSI